MGIIWLGFICILYISVTGKKLELNWLFLEKDTLNIYIYTYIYIYIYIYKCTYIYNIGGAYLRTSHEFSSIENRYLIYDSDTLVITAL